MSGKNITLVETENNVNTIENKCTELSVRMTRNRRIIARILSQTKDHLSVKDIHQKVRNNNHYIGFTTIYRTLNLFESTGVIDRHTFGRTSRFTNQGNVTRTIISSTNVQQKAIVFKMKAWSD